MQSFWWWTYERVITRVDSFHSTSSFSFHGRTRRAFRIFRAIFQTQTDQRSSRADAQIAPTWLWFGHENHEDISIRQKQFWRW